jgi:hypothetical protein
MKKMNKTYEAPVAEVIEMQMPTVLMVSDLNSHSDQTVEGNPWG